MADTAQPGGAQPDGGPGAEGVEVHGTCVEVSGIGVLLRGRSGAGKSDLALRLIDSGARLVADDRTRLRRRGASLVATPHQAIAGMIEARGVGILPVPTAAEAALGLVVDLDPGAPVDRLPEALQAEYLGVTVRRIVLEPFEASAAAKVRLAARAVANGIMPAP